MLLGIYKVCHGHGSLGAIWLIWCRIARAEFPGFLAVHVYSFYLRTGFRIDLFPDDEDDIDLDWKLEFERDVNNLITSWEEMKPKT